MSNNHEINVFLISKNKFKVNIRANDINKSNVLLQQIMCTVKGKIQVIAVIRTYISGFYAFFPPIEFFHYTTSHVKSH